METQKENQDLIGEEIIGFVFKGDGILDFSSAHRKCIEHVGKILKVHETYEKYAFVNFSLPDGYQETLYYPVDQIRKQLEEKNVDVNVLIDDFMKLIPR